MSTDVRSAAIFGGSCTQLGAIRGPATLRPTAPCHLHPALRTHRPHTQGCDSEPLDVRSVRLSCLQHAPRRDVRDTWSVFGFPAPALCQGADEDLMIELGEIILDGCFRRWPSENGFRIWVDGAQDDPATRSQAVARFQIALGVLRAWRRDAGELQDERRSGLGDGGVRNEAGGLTLKVGPALYYIVHGRDIARLAKDARNGLARSQHLHNALWLYGRSNRTAADYYMVHEYARREFGDPRGIKGAIGISLSAQGRLTNSANNLSPLDGGRHATGGGSNLMTLAEQRELISELLRGWIETFAQNDG